MRLFVAVDVPEVEVAGVRLGGPDSPAHLTILFLGEVPAELAPSLAEEFSRSVHDLPSFPLVLQDVGAFPDPARPRVVWIGVGEGARGLSLAHAALAKVARAKGIPVEDRPFVAHLTLRRVRGPADVEQARRWLVELRGREFGRTEVRELLLKESLLGRGPVVHRTIARLPLAGSPPVG